jgi:antitoxin component YwqK of YwqJK toxin-antitoxin module
MRFLFLILSLLVLRASAQGDTTRYYFNEDFQVIKKPGRYAGKSFRQGDLWELEICHAQTGSVVLRSFYIDVELILLDSTYATYFDNGAPQLMGQYRNGKETGLWLQYDSAGRLLDSSVYEKGRVRIKSSWTYETDGRLRTYQYENGNDKHFINRVFADDGTVFLEKDFHDKEGEKRFFYSTGNLYHIERFDKEGNQTLTASYFEDGKEMTPLEFAQAQSSMKYRDPYYNPALASFYTTQLGFASDPAGSPNYPGGNIRFLYYLFSSLTIPKSIREQAAEKPNLTFSFSLDKKGRAVNVVLHSHEDEKMRKHLERVLRNMPEWNMQGFSEFGPLKFNMLVNPPGSGREKK